MVPAGIAISWFACYGTQHVPSSLSWRLPCIIQASGSSVLAACCKFLPSSPRWLILHHHREEAIKEIRRLGISQEEAEQDILRTDEPVTEPEYATRDLDENTHGRPGMLRMMFQCGVRVRTLLAFFLLFMEGMCRIDGILYVGPHHFLSFFFRSFSTVRTHSL